jgi:hypothetical protein
MYRVTCKGCGASVVTEDGNSDRLACTCCPESHSHETAANSCPEAAELIYARHGGAACTMGGPDCVQLTPAGADCPGGHCAPGVPGCTVCRPCHIEFMGQIQLGPVVVVS